jgi:hypothetical protein
LYESANAVEIAGPFEELVEWIVFGGRVKDYRLQPFRRIACDDVQHPFDLFLALGFDETIPQAHCDHDDREQNQKANDDNGGDHATGGPPISTTV